MNEETKDIFELRERREDRGEMRERREIIE